MHWIYAYLICLATLLALDGLFIKFVANAAYRKQLGGLLNTKPKPLPGALLYTMYIGAILLYGVWPLLHLLNHAALPSVLLKVFGWGAGLGFTAFAMYGLTNKSLVKNWPTSIVLIDLAWGAFLTGVATTVGYAFLS